MLIDVVLLNKLTSATGVNFFKTQKWDSAFSDKLCCCESHEKSVQDRFDAYFILSLNMYS